MFSNPTEFVDRKLPIVFVGCCLIAVIKRDVLVRKEAKHTKKTGTINQENKFRTTSGVMHHDDDHHHHQGSRLAPLRSRTTSLPASARNWLALSLPSARIVSAAELLLLVLLPL